MNSSVQRRAESVNFIGSTSVLSAYLLKVFSKWPIQKGHFVKIWVRRFADPSIGIEKKHLYPHALFGGRADFRSSHHAKCEARDR